MSNRCFTLCVGCHFRGVTYVEGQVFSGGEGRCQDCTCSVSAFSFGASDLLHPSQLPYILCFFHREVKWCAHSGDVLLYRAHTRPLMAARVEYVMDAILTDEAVSMENDSHTLQTTVSSAPVWYYHAHTFEFVSTGKSKKKSNLSVKYWTLVCSEKFVSCCFLEMDGSCQWISYKIYSK